MHGTPEQGQEFLYLHSPSDVELSFLAVILLTISNNSDVFSREQNSMTVKLKRVDICKRMKIHPFRLFNVHHIQNYYIQ
jgi:hypothetical protein